MFIYVYVTLDYVICRLRIYRTPVLLLSELKKCKAEPRKCIYKTRTENLCPSVAVLRSTLRTVYFTGIGTSFTFDCMLAPCNTTELQKYERPNHSVLESNIGDSCSESTKNRAETILQLLLLCTVLANKSAHQEAFKISNCT